MSNSRLLQLYAVMDDQVLLQEERHSQLPHRKGRLGSRQKKQVVHCNLYIAGYTIVMTVLGSKPILL